MKKNNDHMDLIKQSIKNKRVLDVGCCATYKKNILKKHKEYKQFAKTIIGVDINKDFLDIAKKSGHDNLYYLDITNNIGVGKFKKQFGTFEEIICGDIIEHISNLGLFLDNIRKLLDDDGIVHIVTPNVRGIKWSYIFLNKMEKQINEDHICWFEQTTITTLLNRHNFQVINIFFDPPKPAEKEWAKKIKIQFERRLSKKMYITAKKEKI